MLPDRPARIEGCAPSRGNSRSGVCEPALAQSRGNSQTSGFCLQVSWSTLEKTDCLQAIGLLERRPGYLKAEATCLRVTTALGEGRLADARAAVPTAWRAALDSRGPVWQHRLALRPSWLEARQ